MKHIVKYLILLPILITISAKSIDCGESAHTPAARITHVTSQRIEEHERAISGLVYNRQCKRYAVYAVLSGCAAYTLYWFFSDHDISLFKKLNDKKIVTQQELEESHKQLLENLVQNYGLSKKAPIVQADAKKSAIISEMLWGVTGKIKSSSVSIAQFGLASVLLTKAEGIFLSNESIHWFYTTEQSIFEKAQNLINWAATCDADMRPDATSTSSTKYLNNHFFLECAHDYIDSLMALIGFMQYKVKSIESNSHISCASSFTSIIEAVTLYATELALKIDSRLTGDAICCLQDEVRKTDRLIESLYKKFSMLEKKYS